MRLIVDTNIFISAILSPSSTISDLIINKIPPGSLFAPYFLFEEVLRNRKKIVKLGGYTGTDFNELLYIFIKRIELLDDEHVTGENRRIARDLVKLVDPWDVEFVALSLQTGYPIWTGDKKLVKGLQAVGFKNCILTSELASKFNH